MTFCLWLSNIATTFYSWAEELNLELLIRGGRKQAVNQIQNVYDKKEFTNVNPINQGQVEESCGFCRMNHSTESCHKLINHVKAEQYFTKNPVIKKILTEKPSSLTPRRNYPKRNTQHNKYAHRSKHVNKVEEDDDSLPEKENASDVGQEDGESDNGEDGEVVHIDED
eukprot:11385750-Ditylum_brightwellii.AAC.1